MAFLVAGERPDSAARSTASLPRLWTWVTRAYAAHRQRVALRALLQFDEHRLNDLGISRQDVIEALSRRYAGADPLSTRRARRAKAWLRSS